MSEAVDRFLAAHAARAAALPGAGLAWLDALRATALERFAASGFPGPRDEDWKYTRLAALERRAFTAAPLPGTDTAAPGDGEQGTLVLIDGRPAGPARGLPAGVELLDLEAALASGDGLLAEHLGRLADAGRHGLAALNAAFMDCGAVLRVARGVRLERPLYLRLRATARLAEHALQPRVLVLMEPDSRACLVESHEGEAGTVALINAVTEVRLDTGACLEHVRIEAGSARGYHIDALEVRQQAGSRLVSRLFTFGAGLARHDLIVHLDGEGASCELDGLYLAGARRHVDCHTRIEHRAPGCTSREDYRGILSGRGRGVFDGRITVHPGAQRSDARQRSANLLLSPHAEADAKPQLVIHADDVQCAHGATCGQLDEQMLFYLRARGLGTEQARAMLTVGFARDLVERLADAELRGEVGERLIAALPGAEAVRGMFA